jgi:PBP1b-binding outer membrane lipoprotein LpoB
MSMVSRYFALIVLLVITIVFLSIPGCGSKQSPTGGKEDTDKLTVLASLPVEFEEISEQKIDVTFSKIVDKSAFMKGYYIYPPIINKKILYDGNIVTLKFLDALNNDTNYYLTLTTRIKDIRGNALDKNQTLVFKHGKLQSNRISGKIIYENPNDTDLSVQVNLLTADSLWVLAKSFTGKSFALEAMNPVDYILRAYIDKNQNGRYDSGTEPYTESSLNNKPVISFDLNMAYADTVKPAIRSVKSVSNREYEIVFNKGLKSYQNIKIEDLKQNDKLRIFTINHNLDRITILTAETDTSSYRFTVTGITDNKGNINGTSSMTISGSNKQDKTAPVVFSTNPRNGASVNNLQPVIEINFSEIIPSSLFIANLKETESNTNIPFSVIKSSNKTYQLQPEKPLGNYKSCILTIAESTSDLSGNKLAAPYILTFLPIIRETDLPKTSK